MNSSNVSEILSRANDHLRRIDDLERRLEERALSTRRRIHKLLERAPTHRQSHLRCFLTHQYENIPPTETSPLPASRWIIRVEGKLLVGHLDHESAVAHDAKTGYEAPNDDLDRSKAEKEEEEILPIKFTHFFEKIIAEFQPVYAPKPNPMAAAAIAKKKAPMGKKRRSGTAKAVPAVDDEEFRKSLVVNPNKQQLVWTKSMSPDAEAFDLTYQAPPPPESRYQIHCVIAKLQLFPSPKEPLYKVAPRLFEILMPNHASHDLLAKTNTKKRATPDSEPLPDVPTDPEIHIPESWSMTDLSMIFYQYVQDNQLFDETLPSTVVCNEKLQTLFQLERFPFSQLQTLLVNHNLVRQDPYHGVEPVRLTYICKVMSATNAPPPDFSHEDEDPTPALLQLDMDVWVPSLFPYRCREILRRIKRRELEYTSARTKARYILMNRKARDEENLKSMIEDAVAKEQLGSDMIPVQIALAKGAPPKTEARMIAHTQARLSLMMERLEEECTEANETWQEYQRILDILQAASTPPTANDHSEPMDTS